MDPHARWGQRLSEYLDGDLTPDETRACAAHLATCAECRALLGDLETLARDARALPPAPPARDLWPAIAARLGPRDDAAPQPARVIVLGEAAPWWVRRLTLSLPQALAASLLLVALAGGGTWLAMRPGGRERTLASAPRPSATASGPTALAPGTASAPAFAPAPSPGRDAGVSAVPVAAPGSIDRRYERTVDQLQRLFATERAHLDTSTVRILDQNLAIIDRAVAEAQRAVDADPSNAYLRSHLASTMRRKVELLRRATVIAGAAG